MVLAPKTLMISSYTVKTIPPESTRRARRGVAPRQKARIPSSRRVTAAQLKVLRYLVRASSVCILVLITLSMSTPARKREGGRAMGSQCGCRCMLVIKKARYLLQWHSGVDSDNASNSTDTECDPSWQ